MANAYQYIKENLAKNLSKKMIEWRKQESVVKVEKPFDIGKARKIGYKDKKGFIIARVKILRGGHKRSKPNKGRKSRKQTVRKTLKMSYQWIAEQRAARKFRNLEVLNSYKLGKDGIHYFFEIILVDTKRPEIISDSTINWICRQENKGRVFRGLTSAGKKSRGLLNKSRNLKIRPSQRAWNRLGK